MFTEIIIENLMKLFIIIINIHKGHFMKLYIKEQINLIPNLNLIKQTKSFRWPAKQTVLNDSDFYCQFETNLNIISI